MTREQKPQTDSAKSSLLDLVREDVDDGTVEGGHQKEEDDRRQTVDTQPRGNDAAVGVATAAAASVAEDLGRS